MIPTATGSRSSTRAATSYTYDPRNNVTNEKYISASKYMTIYSYDNTRMLCNVEAGHE